MNAYIGVVHQRIITAFQTLIGTFENELSGYVQNFTSVVGSGSVNALRSTMAPNVQTKIALYLHDEQDLMTLFGKARLPQSEIAGRAQMMREEVEALQFYLPAEGQTETARLEQLTQEISQMAAAWRGKWPEKIPMVQENLTLEEFNQIPEVMDWLRAGNLPLGLSEETTEVVGVKQGAAPFTLIAYSGELQEQLLQKILLRQVEKLSFKTLLVDFNQHFEESLLSIDSNEKLEIIHQEEQTKKLVGLLSRYVKAQRERKELEKVLVIISDLSNFFQTTQIFLEDFITTLKQASKAGLEIVIFSPHSYISKSIDFMPQAVRDLRYDGLIGARVYDSFLIKAVGLAKEPELESYEIYHATKGGAVFDKIILPRDET